MLTGDHAALAAEIARQTGIDRYRAPQPPMLAASDSAPLQFEMPAAPRQAGGNRKSPSN